MASEEEYNSEQENIPNKFYIKEDSTYPLDNRILYKEIVNNVTKRSFNYIIIKEGIYLDENDKNTNKQSIQCYKIPHNYVVKTTWGRGKKKKNCPM
jgi:hypothetical protein